ncbi:uncharacterized protein LOC143611321 [Bidens hawaiensis]|uniref:uncharacterized protein LOC143611321 n=1 Tax=Bidens hawaiensis TaxID=980011 RepID=UPI00404A2D80
MAVIQPRMLKDFLQDQNLPFPRSRKSSISVFLHAAVSSVKSSSILRRSISRRFSNKFRSVPRVPEPTMTRTTSVTVKDILRWKSFRDLVDPVENDVTPESPRCTVTTATTTSAGTPRSSWCDSDFTVGDDDDESPVCFREGSGESEVTDKKIFHIRNTRDLKVIDQIMLVEEEQFSPISVLDFTHEHEVALTPFHQILEDMEMKKHSLIDVNYDLNKRVELHDTESFIIEEQVIQLMDHVKTSSIEEWDLSLDCLLLDYFRDELITSKDVKKNGRLESRVLNVAKCWVKGEDDGCLEWDMDGRREVCVREMDKRTNWNDFEDDREDVVIEIEKMMLNHLLDELSINLLNI